MRDLNQDLSPQETYLSSLFPSEAADLPSDLIERARTAAVELGKAAISLSPAEARIVSTLISSHGCKKFVEIGTLTGASALWILQGLHKAGSLWTLEKDPAHAKAAKEILKAYQKQNPEQTVTVIEGDAQETLKALSDEGPFDGIFIDGNKSAYCAYLDWAEENLKKGSLIIADNVFLSGAVFTGNTAKFSKKQVEVMREFNRRLADSSKYQSAIIPTSEGLFVAVLL